MKVKACTLAVQFDYLQNTLLKFVPIYEPISLGEILPLVKAEDSIKLFCLYDQKKKLGYMLAKEIIKQKALPTNLALPILNALKQASEEDYISLFHKDQVYCAQYLLIDLALQLSYGDHYDDDIDDAYNKALKDAFSNYSTQLEFDKSLKQKLYQELKKY